MYTSSSNTPAMHSLIERRVQRLFLTSAMILLAVSGLGCRKRSPQAMLEEMTPKETVRISSSDPVVVFARVGQRPNMVQITLLNQTDKAIGIDPRFFAILFNNRRDALRPFDPDIDQAAASVGVVPPEGQQTLQLTFQVRRPLLGQKLIFNPEPYGVRPSMCVIENPLGSAATSGGASPLVVPGSLSDVPAAP